MNKPRIPKPIVDNYEIDEWRHASAILSSDFPNEWSDILALLTQFRIKKSWLNVGGGRKSNVSQSIDDFLLARGWVASTTHMAKLLPRIEGGGGAGFPILVFGKTKRLYDEDC